MRIYLTSFTGADDYTNLNELAAVERDNEFYRGNIEWALLYFPEKECTPRNPSQRTRDAIVHNVQFSAAHLCGEQVFRSLLAQDVDTIDDLKQYSRVQVNINARKVIFTPAEVKTVYDILRSNGIHIIYQYHDDSAALIGEYTSDHAYDGTWDILLDQSKGKGVVAETWDVPGLPGRARYGFAGGISPDNIEDVLVTLEAMTMPRGWIDMESGVRTDNKFDLTKCRQILQAVQG